ncbi:MAG TPA: mannosyltransferase family protein [Chthoniobacterales bacterium]|nr:mannosyltransferase family protein [Chthoniobacterales bacterium]
MRGWLAEWHVVLLAFVVSRLVIAGCILLARSTMVRGPFWQPGGFLEALTQWDSVYYIHIARHGYFHSPETSGTVGFFPFYPLLVRGMSVVFHDFRVAALVTANACLLIAGFLLHRLARREFANRAVADAAVMFLMFGPVSFFFSTAYTEATFLMLAIGAYLAAVERRWLLAGLCGMCLTATRNVGLFMAAALFCEHLRQTWDRRRPLTAFFHPHILAIALVPLGLGLFMLHSYLKSGDALAYAHTTAALWGRVLVSPLQTLSTAKDHGLFYQYMFLGALGFGSVLLTAAAFLKLPAGYLVWCALLMLTYVCSNSLEAMPRYLSVIFPFYFVLGVVAARHQLTSHAMLACSAALLAMNTILLASGYWMT